MTLSSPAVSSAGPATPQVHLPASGGWGLLVAVGVQIVACCLAGLLGCAGYLSDPATEDFTGVVLGVPLLALSIAAGAGAVVGYISGRTDARAGHAQPRPMIIIATVLLGALPAVIAYLTARWWTDRAAVGAGRRQDAELAQAWANWDAWWADHPDPLRAARELASAQWGRPGGVCGFVHNPPGRGIHVANPRGAALVIGPPGSGKTTGVVIPSVLVAPGACVASSIKLDVAMATAPARSMVGTCWVFDPGGTPGLVPHTTPARWSPLVGLRTWDDARAVASRMAGALRHSGGLEAGGGENMAHFIDRARDWLEIHLYAAALAHLPIAAVADWCTKADQEGIVEEIQGILRAATVGDDDAHGPRLAREQHQGLLAIAVRERSSILSTLARMVRVYGSSAARRAGADPTFDPDAFVRSCDTLYLVTPPERVAEYGPIIAALLEAIRHATYRRHSAEATGTEPARPHVTFALDEITNTALIDVSAIVSEAGGQGLHLVVGIQDLSLARARFGRVADGWLTLFRTKIALPGIVDPYTLDALSAASGEYDRTVVSVSQNTTHLGRFFLPLTKREPSWSTQRQRRLMPGDIATIPAGAAIVWAGAEWLLIDCPGYYADAVWQAAAAQRTGPGKR